MKKKQIISEEGIYQAFLTLGFATRDFGTDFMKKYRGYRWYLIPFWRVGDVLYAIPTRKYLIQKPWESFYLDAGKEIHHVHYAYKLHDDDKTWSQNNYTDDRPDEVIGRVWYWYEADVTPVLL